MNTEISRTFASLRGGDKQVAEKLFSLLYQPLREIAGHYMNSEKAGHTLQPTALVHEAFIRLVESEGLVEADRNHFRRLAARVMRHVLVDHARGKLSAKRGGDLLRVTFNEDSAGSEENFEITALNDAINKLSKRSERMAQIIELRFFAGLTVEDTAETLSVSERTIYDDWAFARSWLRKELSS